MKLKYFYKLDHNKEPILGSNIRRKSKPGKQWKEIALPCCDATLIPPTGGYRFFVQLDGAHRPVDGTLIKRSDVPAMSDGIHFMEIDWRSPCCIV